MRTLVLTIASLFLLAPLAAAEDCSPELTVQAPNGTYYSVDNDLCQPDCLFSIWVYGDDDPDPCGPEDESNTIIF